MRQTNLVTDDCLEAMTTDGIIALESMHFSLETLEKEQFLPVGLRLGAINVDTCSSEKFGLYQVKMKI